MPDEFVHRNNPAGRLYYLLENAKRVTSGDMLDGWRVTLDIRGASEPVVLSHIAEVFDLLHQAEMALSEALGDNSTRLITPIKRIKEYLIGAGLSQSWAGLTNLISDEVLMTVALAAEKLAHAGRTEIEIESEELDAIQSDLEELLRTVRTSEIDPEFKEFLIDELEIIRQALVSYRIGGPTTLTRAFDLVAGGRLRTNAKFTDGSYPEVTERFDNLLVRLAKIVSACSKVKMLTSATLRLLGIEIEPEHRQLADAEQCRLGASEPAATAD